MILKPFLLMIICIKALIIVKAQLRDEKLMVDIQSTLEDMQNDSELMVDVQSTLEGLQNDSKLKHDVQSTLEHIQNDGDLKNDVQSALEDIQNDSELKHDVQSTLEDAHAIISSGLSNIYATLHNYHTKIHTNIPTCKPTKFSNCAGPNTYSMQCGSENKMAAAECCPELVCHEKKCVKVSCAGENERARSCGADGGKAACCPGLVCHHYQSWKCVQGKVTNVYSFSIGHNQYQCAVFIL